METKKTKILAIVALVAFILTIVGATYAYFQAQVGDPAAVDISVNAHTVDTFTFATGDPLSISLDQDTFASGTGNQVVSTYASAKLAANNKTNNATEHYYMYLSIESNTFGYTIDESTPEMILSITDKSGNPLTEISGLTYVTIGNVTGFDITNKSGLITILSNREIVANPDTEEKWNVTITYVNYDENQSENAGKSMSAELIIQKDKLTTVVSDVCSKGDNLSTCITTLASTSKSSYTNIYHHDGTITSKSEFIITTGYDEDGNEVEKTYPAGTVLDANDSSYRYAGANELVNNFVCFGYDGTDACPTDNLYRIIGVFGDSAHGVSGVQLVKLIKYDYAMSALLGMDGDYYGLYGDYYGSYFDGSEYYKQDNYSNISSYSWNYKATNKNINTWSTSLLNKINLNKNFLENIGITWTNKIVEVKWKVGGNTRENIDEVPPIDVYKNEIVNPVTTGTTDNTTEYLAKIGIMYVSDYGFAASPSAWTLTMNNYDNSTVVNWMYMGLYEWTITRISDNVFDLNIISQNGYIGKSLFWVDGLTLVGGAIRPTFYLNQDTTYISGSGSANDPIVIN